MTVGLPSPETSSRVDVSAARTWLVERRDEMVDDLATYVSFETPSTDTACLDRGLSWIEGWLASSLGAPSSSRTVDGGDHGDVMVVEYPGAGTRPLLVLCHYDTVWGKGTLRERPFRVAGSVATGPGVFDMKAGLIQFVWAMRALERFGLSRAPVRLLLNGDEELGSPASRPVIEAASEGVSAVLVPEPAADGSLKTSRKGVGIFRIDVDGVEAHAGLDPTGGASAIDELARVILHLRSLADLERGTSVNVGVVQGGSRSNVIAGNAWAKVDVRVACAAEATRIEMAIAALVASEPRLRVTVGGGWNRPVMERTEAIADIFALARQLAAGLGLQLTETGAGGASDANFVAGRGLPILDGLGAVGAGAHSRSEYVDIDAMPERAALAAALVHAFSLD
jgi:glutamate carboxypeptidase